MKTLITSLCLLVAGSLLAVGANAQPNLLVAGDFEGITSLTSYSAPTTGVWGTESSILSGAGNGITPFGSQMLELRHAGGGGAAQTNQIVYGPFRAGSVVTFSVKFNTWLAASASTPQTAAVSIQTDSGLSLTGTRYTSPTVALDTDTSTWQTATVTVTLPSDTNYLSAEIILWQYSGALPFGTPLAYADDAVLTVVPPAQHLFFTDALTGPSSPNLTPMLPTAKYGYTTSGLARIESDSGTDRPMVSTGLSTYLTASDFTAEVTLSEASGDLVYFGVGQGDNDAGNNNEPAHAFVFRVHHDFDNYGQLHNEIQADVVASSSTTGGFYQAVNIIGYTGPVLPGQPPAPTVGPNPTLRIVRSGDNLTMSVVGGGSVTYSITAFNAVTGLTNANTSVFFGNTSVGSVFSNLKIYAPPVITSPGNLTAEATGPTGAAVTFTATAVDSTGTSVPVVAVPASGSTFPLGVTTVDLGATDSQGNQAFATFTVTVQDTTPPVIAAPADITAEATSAAGAAVTFNATAQDLVDGAVPVVASPASGSTFPIGITGVTLTATDAHHNQATASFNVTVRDTTPPVITSVTPSSATLWPPNHQMVPITVAVNATDNTGVTSLKIISVTSSEPDNGLGDGDTPHDIVITGPLTVNLRAERSGKGNGRTYTITVQASDAYGNQSEKTCTVFVPKSQGKDHRSDDDEPAQQQGQRPHSHDQGQD